MVQINFAQKTVNAKIVYYGPGMSGKTTNLEVVHQRAPEQNRGDLTSISTDGDRTLFFDFMPLDLGTVAGMRTAFQIYTVPGQVYYNSTRKLVLQGVDGVVFVADSGANMVEENLESLRNLEENLNEYGKSLATLPHVIQYNKRDLPDALSVEELQQRLNKHGAPTYEAVANTGQGVFPTLKALAACVLETIHKGGRQGAPQQAPQAPAQAAPAAPVPQPMAQPQMAQPQAVGAQPVGAPQPGFGQPAYPQASAPAAPPAPNLHMAPPAAPQHSAPPPAPQAPAAGSLQMAPPPQQQPMASPPPVSAPAPKQTAPRPAPRAKAKPKKLEQTRFRPRASRPEPRPTPAAKSSGNKAYTWAFVGLAIAVGAVLTKVIISFF